MDNFDYAHYFTATWEGGLTDHPADKGGVTAYGVSLAFLKDFAQSATGRNLIQALNLPYPVSRETILKITAEKARAIFRQEFWQGRLEDADKKIACFVYDSCVNHGKARGVRFIQQAACNCGKKLDVDGIIGPCTRAAIARGDEKLVKEALGIREKFYYNIVESNRSQKVFLKGWLNRVHALRQYLGL